VLSGLPQMPKLSLATRSTTTQVTAPRRREQRIGEVREQIAGRPFRCAEDIAVLGTAGELLGMISIERLLAADANASVGEVRISRRALGKLLTAVRGEQADDPINAAA
jgi:hypothetical protein